MKVLLIDDDPIIRRVLTRLFEHHNIIIEAVASGDEADELLTLNGHDIAIVDYCLRCDPNGLELINRLSSKHPEQRFAILSGWVDESLVAPSASKENFHFISKALEPEDLVKTVIRAAGQTNNELEKS